MIPAIPKKDLYFSFFTKKNPSILSLMTQNNDDLTVPNVFSAHKETVHNYLLNFMPLTFRQQRLLTATACSVQYIITWWTVNEKRKKNTYILLIFHNKNFYYNTKRRSSECSGELQVVLLTFTSSTTSSQWILALTFLTQATLMCHTQV